MFRHSITLFVLILFIASCATVTRDIKVAAEADPDVDLSKFKTYAWLGSASILHDPDGKWEPADLDSDAEIKWLIDRELRKRGITEVTVKPDMIVGFAAGIDMSTLGLLENSENRLGMVKNVPKGALAVVFIDASTGYPIWIGNAKGNIQKEPTVDVVKKRLDFAVTRMFWLLP